MFSLLMSSSERSRTLACESLMEAVRAKETSDCVGECAALLRVKALAHARMWEAQSAAEYTDLELLSDEMTEALQLSSLASLDASVLGTRSAPLFREAPAPLSAAQVLADPRAKADLEFACKRPIAPPLPKAVASASASAYPSAVPLRADVTGTPPEMCCGFPVSEYITQSGDNRGRPYRKCDSCGKWKGFSDDKSKQNGRIVEDEDEDAGAIKPARAALGQTRRSGSAGKRQIKYPGPGGVNRGGGGGGGSEDDEPAAEVQHRNAPDFQLASKRLKSDDRASHANNTGGYNSNNNNNGNNYNSSSSSNNNNNNNSNNSDRGSRSFNPARSVVDAINATDGGGAVKRKPFSGPARRGEEKEKKQEGKKEYDDPIYSDERLKTVDPQHVENILSEIMDMGQQITWDDIAGLEFAKNSIKVCFDNVFQYGLIFLLSV